MEYEFKVRDTIFNGTEQDEPERSSRDTAYGGRSGAELDGGAEDIEFDMSVAGRDKGRTRRDDENKTSERIPVGTARDVRAEGSGEQAGSETDTADAQRYKRETHETGWEYERGILIKAERARKLAAESKLKAVQSSDSITSAAIDTVGDVAALATLIEDSDEDEDKHYAHLDRKRLKVEWEKKESLGMHMG